MSEFPEKFGDPPGTNLWSCRAEDHADRECSSHSNRDAIGQQGIANRGYMYIYIEREIDGERYIFFITMTVIYIYIYSSRSAIGHSSAE